MRQKLAALGAGLALLALASPRARADNDLLKNARNTFEYGDYQKAAKLTETLLASHQLVEERDLIEAYRIAGLSDFFLSQLQGARQSFVALLSIDPDYAMDPFLVPPAAVAFFDGVKRDNQALLEPIRERKKALAEQKKLAEQARQKLIEENLLRQMEPKGPVLVERVEVHTYLPNFLPFGTGQFEEGRNGMGALFAGTQLAGLATSIICFAEIENLRDPFGKYAQADAGTISNLRTAKWAGLGLFGVSVALGIADSLVHFQPTTTSIVALPQPPNRTMPASPSSPLPKPKHAQNLKPTLTPWAAPHGFGLQLALRF